MRGGLTDIYTVLLVQGAWPECEERWVKNPQRRAEYVQYIFDTSDSTEIKIDVREENSKIMHIEGFKSNGDH